MHLASKKGNLGNMEMGSENSCRSLASVRLDHSHELFLSRYVIPQHGAPLESWCRKINIRVYWQPTSDRRSLDGQ